MPGLQAYESRCDSTGNFDEGGQKLEALAQLMSVDRFRDHVSVIGDHPTYLVRIAVAPQDAADGPDVGLSTAMRASANGRAAIERERDHIVSVNGHLQIFESTMNRNK